MRRRFTCYRCGTYVEAEINTDGDATCPACENVIGLDPQRKLQNRIASLELQLSEARARLAWIPVSERLPEVGEAVLIAYRIGRKWYIARARMNKEGQFRFTKNTKPVTHWMPLPEPPEVQE